MAERLHMTELAVMQSLYIVHGRPSWSASFIIAAINKSGRFAPLRFEIKGEGDNKSCICWTTCRETKERLESSPITIKMAKAEGWYGKNGSKWQTMEDQMLRYRSAAFFGRIYAPDILMGMQTDDEVREIKDITPPKEVTVAPTINAVEMLESAAAIATALPVIDTETGEILQEVATGNQQAAEATIEPTSLS
ncbi:MAG: hypothetical protein ACKO96_31690, partial [Flammeovirgaceae bacterium]